MSLKRHPNLSHDRLETTGRNFAKEQALTKSSDLLLEMHSFFEKQGKTFDMVFFGNYHSIEQLPPIVLARLAKKWRLPAKSIEFQQAAAACLSNSRRLAAIQKINIKESLPRKLPFDKKPKPPMGKLRH